MTWFRLVRAELRKITTTRLLWGFLAVLALIAALNASLIILATDADGTKGFIATAEDQRTLLAFAYNALFGTALFGAIAAAREYAHNTIVPTMLLAPRRHVAMLAHFTAVLVAGAVLGLAGGSLVMIAGAISMPFADSSLCCPSAPSSSSSQPRRSPARRGPSSARASVPSCAIPVGRSPPSCSWYSSAHPWSCR